MTARKIIFGLIWLSLVSYSVISSIYGFRTGSFAPVEQDFNEIIKMSMVEWEGINPIEIAIFYIMGIFPLVYGAFMLFDSKESQISPYPFFIASFGLGAFALLPYFVLRHSHTTPKKKESILLKTLDSPLTAIVCSISIVVLVIWGVVNGDWSSYLDQWQHSQFIRVMSLDFCTLSLLLPAAILKDDMHRRGIKNSKLFWLIASIPLFGSLAYWCFRPQLDKLAEA